MKLFSIVIATTALVLFSTAAFSQAAHAHSHDSPVYFVKNTNDGLFVGSEANPHVESVITSSARKAKDSTASSGHVYDLHCKNSCQDDQATALTMTNPVYSNSNYTLEITLRNKLEARHVTAVKPARLSLLGDVKSDLNSIDIPSQEYTTLRIPFRTANTRAQYQKNTGEAPVGFSISKDPSSGECLFVSILEAKLIPNAPQLELTEPAAAEYRVPLDHIQGKTREEVVELYMPQITTKLTTLVVDLAHNNNPVDTHAKTVDDKTDVINSSEDSFELPFQAEKWGSVLTSTLKIIIDPQSENSKTTPKIPHTPTANSDDTVQKTPIKDKTTPVEDPRSSVTQTTSTSSHNSPNDSLEAVTHPSATKDSTSTNNTPSPVEDDHDSDKPSPAQQQSPAPSSHDKTHSEMTKHPPNTADTDHNSAASYRKDPTSSKTRDDISPPYAVPANNIEELIPVPSIPGSYNPSQSTDISTPLSTIAHQSSMPVHEKSTKDTAKTPRGSSSELAQTGLADVPFIIGSVGIGLGILGGLVLYSAYQRKQTLADLLAESTQKNEESTQMRGRKI